MADETTQRIRILLDLEQEAHDRAAKKSAREIARLEKQYDPLSRATIKYQQESQKLAAGLEKGTITAQRHAELMDRVQREYDQTTAKLARLNTVQTANVNTQSGMIGIVQRNRAAFQGLGYQVGDAAVQIQGGTSAIVALTQQGSQMLGMFGAFGALAGAALAIAAPLAASFFKSADGADDAEDALEGFNGALDRYESHAKIATSSTEDLRTEFGEYAREVREFSRFMARVEAGQALTALNETDLMAGLGPAVAAAEDYAASMKLAREQARAQGVAFKENNPALVGLKMIAADAAAELGLTVDQTQKLGPLVKKLNGADGWDGVRDASADILRLMEGIYGESLAIPKEVAEFMRQIRQVHDRAASLATIMDTIKDTADDLARTDMAAGLRDAVGEAGKLAGKLLEALGFGEQIAGLDFSNFNLRDFADRMQDRLLGSDAPLTEPRSQFDRSGVSASALTAMSKLEQAAERIFQVTSAHRDAGHNARVGGAKNSQHIQGNAFDISTRGMSREEKIEIIQIARSVAGFGGVGVYSNSLHFDTGKTRAWGPDYSSGSIPAWAASAVQTPRAGDAEAARAQAEALRKSKAALAEADRKAAQATREAEAAERDRTRALEQSQGALDGLRGSLDPLIAAEQDYVEALRIVDEALANGQITADAAMATRAQLLAEYQQRIADIQEAAARTPEESAAIKRLQGQYESLTNTLIRAAQAGENVGQALLGWIANAALTAGIQKLSQAMAEMTASAQATGGGSFWGSILGAVFGGGFANGGAFDRGAPVPFANGGVVDSAQLFPMAGGKTGLMGEAGPEAIMPLKRINGKLGVAAMGGGQSVTVNQPITIDARGAVEGTAKIIAREIDKRRPQFAQDAVKATYAANRERPLQ